MGMTSEFRRSVSHDSKRSGGGGGGSWREQMRLPKDVPTPIMMINASYIDPAPSEDETERDPATGLMKPVKKQYAKGRKHKRKMGPHGIVDDECSAGWNPHNPKPCVGCFYQDSGDKQFTTGDVFRIGIVHLVPYHGHPVQDKQNGQWLMRKEPKPGENPFFLNYDPCEATPQRPGACNYCRIMQNLQPVQNDPKKPFPMYPQGSVTWKFGHRRYLEFGKGHLSDLIGWDQLISMKCGTTLQSGEPCGMPLVTLGFNCPTCNHQLIDLRTDTRTDQQIMDAVSKPYPCMTCQKGVMVVEMQDCESCRAAGRTFTMNGLFSGLVLYGMRQGEDMKSKLVLSDSMTLEKFSRMVPANFLPQGKTLQQVIEEYAKPYDFEQLCKPRDLPNQAQRYQVQMPPQLAGYAQQQQTQNLGGYQQPPQAFTNMPGAQAPMMPPSAQAYTPAVPYGQPPMPTPAPMAPQPAPVPGMPTPGYPPGGVPAPQFQPQPGYPPQPQFAPQPNQQQFQPNGNAPGVVPVPARPNFSN